MFRIAFFCGVLTGLSSCTTPLTSSEKMMLSTYPLATAKGMATCLIINRKDPAAPDGTRPVILSSAHLLAGTPRGPFFIAFRQPRPGNNPAIGFLELRAPDPTDHPVVRHPYYDIAALSLDIPPEFTDKIVFKSYINESTIGGRGTEPHAGDEVSVLGFPHVYPGTEGAFPVLRAGKIASYSATDSHQPGEFLVNTTVFAGDSGGPVFAGHRHGAPKLLGMIVERVGKEKSGVALAVAVNASVVRETLALQAREEHDYIGGDSNKASQARRPMRSGVQLIGPPKSLEEMLKLWKGRP